MCLFIVNEFFGPYVLSLLCVSLGISVGLFGVWVVSELLWYVYFVVPEELAEMCPARMVGIGDIAIHAIDHGALAKTWCVQKGGDAAENFDGQGREMIRTFPLIVQELSALFGRGSR